MSIVRGDLIQTLTKRNYTVSFISLALCFATAILLLIFFIEDKSLESAVTDELKETFDTEKITINFIQELEDSIVVSYQLEGYETTFLSFFERDNGDLTLVNTREVEE